MEDNRIYYGIILIAVILLLLQAIQIWQCYQDECCTIHWLVWNKEAVCPGSIIWQLPH